MNAYMKRLAFVALIAAAGCSKKSESAEAPVAAPEVVVAKVQTAPVVVQRMPRFLTLTGSVMADRQSEVAANVVGRITSAPIERGQTVRQGQTLAVVDARELAFTNSAMEAQAKVADSQAALAKADCERYDALNARGAVSKADYDRQKAQCTTQLYTARAAGANAELAAKRAGDTTIRAPFDGVVGERYVNQGEYVLAQTKVASVYRIDPVRIQISVPEQAVALIKQGATLQVVVSAYPDRTFPAAVRYVAPALRSATRDLLVEAVAENKDGALRPGMFATVQIQTGESDEPTVPKDALRIEGTTKRMFLARGGQALEMVVRTGAEKDGRIAIAEPLTATDKVIMKPQPGLRDGSPVKE